MPAKVPQARELWESGCSAPAGSNTGYGEGLRGPGRAPGCSHHGLLAPWLSSAAGATAQLLVGCSLRLPPTEVCGARAGGRGAHPFDGQRSPSGSGAWHCRHRSPAGTLPRAARPRGRAGSRRRHLGKSVWGAPAPAPLRPQCLATLPEPSVAVTRRGGPGVLNRDAGQRASCGSAHRSDAWHLPRRCQPSLPSTASRVSITPGWQPSPAPALRPSPTHASCGQAAGRRAGRLQADALCLGLLQG